MKVLLIHQVGSPRGSGGAIATWRLHEALRSAGVASTLACQRFAEGNPGVVELPPAGRVDRLLGKLTWRMGLNDVHCLSTFRLPREPFFQEADVVNIHGWHSEFFSYLALPRLARTKPVVATLHDMWNFTGHCGYSKDCDRWKSGCGRCPHLEAHPPVARDATALEWRLKRWAYRRSDITVAVPSRWLVDLVGQSMMAHLPLEHIPNAVDTDLFRPLDKAACRHRLGLPPDRLVLMFAAAALSNPVKGADLLVEALRELPARLKDRVVLLLLGDGADLGEACGMTSLCLGYVFEDEAKAVAYSAADVFVLPSRFENQSLIGLETLACGTPMVAFETGGNRELLQEGEAGLLAPPEDVAALRGCIAQMLEDDSLRLRLSEAARRCILQRHSMSVHAGRYLELYERVIAERRGVVVGGDRVGEQEGAERRKAA